MRYVYHQTFKGIRVPVKGYVQMALIVVNWGPPYLFGGLRTANKSVNVVCGILL